MSEVKFTESELKEVKDLQKEYIDIQNRFGQLNIAEIRVNQQVQDLEKAQEATRNQFLTAQTNEKNLIDRINKKYGDGNLDIASGVFTPNPKTTSTDKK
mgnify:CR=1 FL=1|tara:strand:+ start:46 stop:342 length:297 start_codon:yes stop_codon:yes gene_type:complete